MTIMRFELDNFGVYAGNQVLDFSQAGTDRPIVLVGGENGRGKTTLLEALFLVLYGKLSPLFASSGKSYQDYLESRINGSLGSDRGASLTLELTIQTSEGLERLEVFRGWTFGDPRQTEHFSVKRDTRRDEWLTNNWGSYWTEILPPNIAELFFFDGERIESLADAKTSARVVKDSVYALFGLLPLTKLQADLSIVEKRSIKDSDKDSQSELHQAFQAHKLYQESLERAQETCVVLEQRRATIAESLEKAKSDLLEKGGGSDIVKNREKYQQELRELHSEAERADARLREIAAGDAPFLLIEELIGRTMSALKHESSFSKQDSERRLAQQYRQEILNHLHSSNGNGRCEEVSTIINAFFEEKISSFTEHDHEPLFPESLHELARSRKYTESRLEETKYQFTQPVELRQDLSEQISILEARLATLPPEESVQHLIEKEEEATRELQQITAELTLANERRDSLARMLEESRRRYTRIAESELKKHNDNEDTIRIVTHAQRTQDILDQLEHRLVRKHLSKLEIELSEKLAMLHSKRLVENVRICPDTFEIELSTAGGQSTPASRLSAGERQLLALAVLWAVQSYSDKKMPMFVDTPLGRLDSKHRKNMVERFLTEASHQTIVLSTDSEVTPELAESVKEYIGAQYRLDYHEEDQSTRVVEGYFSAHELGTQYEAQHN